MPDFFLLSGLLLARVIERDWRAYLDRKVVHFAYFYLLWLTILFAFESPWMAAKQGWPAVGAGYLRAYVHPYSMLWFIYLLPVFFVVTKLLHRVPVAIVWTIAAALQVAQPETGIKVLDKFVPYYVYFYTGFVLAPCALRFADAVSAHRGKALLGLALWAALDAHLVSAGYAALPLLSLALAFAGVYVGLPRSPCGRRTAGTGAIIGFLGIACPVCNKVLVLLVGSALLLEYFEPLRLYVALGGAALLALAVWLKLARPECLQAEARSSSTPA